MRAVYFLLCLFLFSSTVEGQDKQYMIETGVVCTP